MNNIDMIKMIISDINISKDEKYMLLIFKLSNEENKNNVTINIKALMEQFESRRKAKIFDILKSLQNKGYIEIIKNKGKSNNYKLVKSYLDNVNTGSKNDTSIKNDTTSSIVSDTTSGSKNDTSIKNDTTSSITSDTTSGNKNDTSIKNDTTSSIASDTTSGNKNDTSIKNDTTSSIASDTTSGNKNDTSIKNDTTSSIASDTTSGSKNDTGIKNDTTSSIASDTTSGNKNDTSIKNDTTSSVVSDTTIENINNNINNNNNNINNNNNNINNIYNKILITWNKININNEKFINNQVVEAMNTAIKTYKIYEIIDAIKNYSKGYSSDHYYSYRWNLIKFLTQSNGIRRFLNTGDIWLDYKSRYYSRQDEIRNLGIDIENYID